MPKLIDADALQCELRNYILTKSHSNHTNHGFQLAIEKIDSLPDAAAPLLAELEAKDARIKELEEALRQCIGLHCGCDQGIDACENEDAECIADVGDDVLPTECVCLWAESDAMYRHAPELAAYLRSTESRGAQDADGVEWHVGSEWAIVNGHTIAIECGQALFTWVVFQDGEPGVVARSNPVTPPHTREEARRQAVEAARGMGTS